MVETLGLDCGVACAIAQLLETGSTPIAAGMPVDGHAASVVARVARDFAARGWLEAVGNGWRRSARPLPSGLSEFLQGAAAMRRTMLSAADTSVVVTLPAGPSAIAQALPAEGPIHATVRSTEE